MSFGITRPIIKGSGVRINYLRVAKFLSVGAFCTTLQYFAFFTAVQALGLDQWWQVTVMNSCAFVVSTQVNYLLSFHITWHDRKRAGQGSPYEISSLVKFNLMAMTSLSTNTLVFASAVLVTSHIIALIAGTASGLLLAFAVSHKFVFNHKQRESRSSAILPSADHA